MKRYFVPALIITLVTVTNARAQYNTHRGSVLGGLAGAAAGAAIGENNDKPLAGALIGGAVGLVTGAAMGNSRDRQLAESRAYQYQQQQQVRYQQQQQVARSVSVHDVISLSRSGVSDSVIINHIQTNGVRQQLQVADVITLHENGVSQNVITAMQHPQATPSPTVVVNPQPVYHAPAPIVIERYSTPRYHYPPPRPYYHNRHHQHRGGSGVRFSIGR